MIHRLRLGTRAVEASTMLQIDPALAASESSSKLVG